MCATLRKEWERFLKTRTKAELVALVEAGFDITNPTDENVPYTRRFDTSPGAEDDGEREYAKCFNGQSPFVVKNARPEEEAKAEPSLDFAVSVAARVIDAFDCVKIPAVALQADCLRLAIGYPSCGSQSDVARRHGVNRATVSFRVIAIQGRLGLPVNVVANSRQKVRNR